MAIPSHARPLQRLWDMDADIPTPSDPPPIPPDELVWAQFLALLDALPPTARAAFMLHDVFGATVADVSIALGLPLQACHEQVALARKCAHEHAQRLASIARPS